jgi:hypothetical protein
VGIQSIAILFIDTLLANKQTGGVTMRKDRLIMAWDMIRYRHVLKMSNDNKKEFYDLDGCGLEIEFGVFYERRCRTYIETGLRKIKERVGEFGKFVPDMTIGQDLNVEIVLVPLLKEPLGRLFSEIKEIIDYYENFRFDENCGVHANFRADANLKHAFYQVLVNGGYDSSRFIHSKYKKDLMDIAAKPSGDVMTYYEYVDHQKRVSAKYAGVNFLKDHLVEFRTLDLNWDDIAYVYDLYELAKRINDSHAVIDLFPKRDAVPKIGA